MTQLRGVKFNGVDISKVVFNGLVVWEKLKPLKWSGNLILDNTVVKHSNFPTYGQVQRVYLDTPLPSFEVQNNLFRERYSDNLTDRFNLAPYSQWHTVSPNGNISSNKKIYSPYTTPKYPNKAGALALDGSNKIGISAIYDYMPNTGFIYFDPIKGFTGQIKVETVIWYDYFDPHSGEPDSETSVYVTVSYITNQGLLAMRYVSG